MIWQEGAGVSIWDRILLSVAGTLSFLLRGRWRTVVWVGVSILVYLAAPIFGKWPAWSGIGILLIYGVLSLLLAATQRWLEREEQRRENPV
ncbi:MAG: hypothetical protein A2172_02310 [Candidatus Woykebacteria bacterium RBG_13_40_15]|uniref:Uncharacterized protein n=1 Tax=Candidatus Woykebacteria bacterium RBG_13_40_15 TaxID=1802593 RepID=A0A1G1W6A1_9BACT|nr:MAG: hypothetical protein A2172_02310 [Candidatus Woykebacteria bacterium RBG_13_40_15]